MSCGVVGALDEDLASTTLGATSMAIISSIVQSSLPSSLTTDGCFLLNPRPTIVVGIPLSKLFELLTPTGGLGSGLLPGELKPILSSDLTDDNVSDRSMVACIGL